MGIFQKSVIQKHLANYDKETIEKAWAKFSENYSDTKIQKIKYLKEEEYQDGFLRDVFVDVLNYTLKPDENYNLVREFKNQSDGKKADGAIIKNENAIAVIELKSTKTKDLTNVTQQAFNYKNDQPECKYIITSNFQKLRFYIDYSNEYEEFDLFNLQKSDFKLLYLILNKDSILSDLPLKLKEETKFHEENISDKLYKDYSNFKQNVYHNLVKNNPQYDKLTLFKKAQKLLDRLLFMLFAEDTGLIPPNTISDIAIRYKVLIANDMYIPYYDVIKQFFGYLNTGEPKFNIPIFNGGLFAPDEILDNVKIDDEILEKDSLKLSAYDFNSEVDVNILGHIFEHSLNEIEEITAEIESESGRLKPTVTNDSETSNRRLQPSESTQLSAKKVSKRKSDGVFYTPKYITQYIVENTIGKLCTEKRKEFNIEEIEFNETYKTKDNKLSAKGKELFEVLSSYKEWLISLKIIDPACGSGAFLNQALSFLIEEHKQIDDVIADLTGDRMRLFDTDKAILENNLYGVDINEESVEIAKLSLWLRTAQKGRKLSNLSDNIKCGNSLIEDPEVAGDKAFNWNVEFKEIMGNGGFDVVIGNPPYIKEYTNKQAFDGLHKHYCYQGKMDIWYIFGALALDISKKEKGLIGYIAPNNWITNSGASKFRNIVINNAKLIEFIDFGDFKVFDSAGIQTMIYIMTKSEKNNNYSFKYSKVLDKKIKHADAQLFLEKLQDEKFDYFDTKIQKEKYLNTTINFINAEISLIIDKIKSKQNFELDKKEVAQGIVPPQDFLNKKNKDLLGDEYSIGEGVFNLSTTEYESFNFSQNEKKLIKPFYTSKELNRYFGQKTNNYWIIYTDSKFQNEDEILPYPKIKQHLDRFASIITSVYKPYGLHRARVENFFQGKKIISLRKCTKPTFTFTDFDCYVSQTYFSIKTEIVNLKYLTGLLNSRVIMFWLKNKGKMQGDLFQVDKEPLLSLPLIKPNEKIQIQIAELVTFIIENKQKQLDYTDLLEKAKAENNFDREIQLSKALKEMSINIEKYEKEIDAMVYELYELSEAEIAVVEGVA